MFTGQDLINKAAAHLNQEYRLGVFVPKNNPNWHGPWDCSEFASWCVFQVCNRLYGCENDNGAPDRAKAFTGFWERDAQTLGRIITVQQASATPGAAVLRFPVPGGVGHIVFSDGSGGTIEAHSRNTGVIRSKLADRRWDIGILVPDITYQTGTQTAEPVAAPATIFRLTDPLMRGAAVSRIQSALEARGFNPGKIDGTFGTHTSAAVIAFQIDQGLVADGEVGTQTAAALGISLA
jgi:putative peptidoglycan binding protein